MRVASLHVYPVKSFRGLSVDKANVEATGLAGDRRWMVVDSEGRFLTQRTHPALATIGADFTQEGLLLSAEGFGDAAVPFPDGGERLESIVWEASVNAALAGQEANDWLSAVLGEPAKLVAIDGQAGREKISVWTDDPVPMSFADAFPILVATTGSLAALNRDIKTHGGEPVPMARFRPNIVIDCDEAWPEDHWRALIIGDVSIDLVKPSDRCVVTTTDQITGARMGKEPLASLARIHRSTDPRINGVIFGVNAVPRSFGEIAVGDAVLAV